MEFNWVMLLVGLGLVFAGFYLGLLTMLLRVINNPMWAVSMITTYNKQHVVQMLDNLPAPTPQEIEQVKAKLKAMHDSRGE
jgi:hypothetical protein